MRPYIYILCIGFILIFSGCGKQAGDKQEEQPRNIVFILCDDHRWDFTGVITDPGLKELVLGFQKRMDEIMEETGGSVSPWYGIR